MRIGTRGYYTLSLIKNGGNVQAILFPLSKSAIYSVYLLENNNQRFSLATDPSFLLLPSNSSLDNKDNIIQILLPKANIYGIKGRYNRIIILQSQEKEKFTFSILLKSNIVLKHSNLVVEGQYQINIIHFQLYPNPNYSVVILYNGLTSTFVVQPLPTKYITYRV